MKVEFHAGPDDAGRRLETVLRRLCPGQSLATLHKALRQGDVRLNGSKTAADSRVQPGDVIAVWDALVGPSSAARPEGSVPLPPGWLLWEDPDWVVVNKPSGVLVHRGDRDGPSEPLLDELVRAWLAGGLPASLGFRPGPLHRLDRETSGLVVFSRSLRGARAFSEALVRREVTKTYLAVLRGDLRHPVSATARLIRDPESRTTAAGGEGETADTQFVPLAWGGGLTLAQVHLGTGRTHQIRAHAQSLGHPLAGDRKYGGGPTPGGLDVPWLLHAWKIETRLFPPLTAPLPGPRRAWLEQRFHFSL